MVPVQFFFFFLKKKSFISSISVQAPGQRSLTNSTFCEESALVPRSSRVPKCRRCYHNILWNRNGSSPGMGEAGDTDVSQEDRGPGPRHHPTPTLPHGNLKRS